MIGRGRSALALAGLLMVGGCAQQMEEAFCDRAGYLPGTDGYLDCMQMQEQDRQVRLEQSLQMMQQGVHMATCSPVNPYCN